MIGIDGNFLINFKLGDIETLIREDDLISFLIIEETGNALPTFQLSFNTMDENILSQFHEGNELKVSMGRDLDSMVDTPLKITRFQTKRTGESKRLISAVGFYSALPYFNSTKLSLNGPLSAVEVINSVVSNYFTPDFNVDKSLDSQVWVQHNVSDRKFVFNMWLHADLGTSFPAVAITTDGQFRLRDVLKDFKSDYDWRFTNKIENDKDIQLDGSPSYDYNTGFLNSVVGYGSDMTVYDVENGEESSVSTVPGSVLSLTDTMPRSSDVGKRYASSGILNDNVHPNYWNSYNQNRAYLTMFGALKTITTFSNRFVPIKVLDKVILNDSELGELGRSSAEFHSGLYYVTKVARSVTARSFVTSVVLCRESLNSVQIPV